MQITAGNPVEGWRGQPYPITTTANPPTMPAIFICFLLFFQDITNSLDVCSRSTSSGSARSFLVKIQTCTSSLVLPNIFVNCDSCRTSHVWVLMAELLEHCRDTVMLVRWYSATKNDLCCGVNCGRAMLFSIQCINVGIYKDDHHFYTIAWHSVMSHHWKFVSSKAHPTFPTKLFDSVKTLSPLCASQLKSNWDIFF